MSLWNEVLVGKSYRPGWPATAKPVVLTFTALAFLVVISLVEATDLDQLTAMLRRRTASAVLRDW